MKTVLVLAIVACYVLALDFTASSLNTVVPNSAPAGEPTYCVLGANQTVFCAGILVLFDRVTNAYSIIAGTPGSAQSTGDDGSLAINAKIHRPYGLAYDKANDRLFVAETAANRIRYIKNGLIFHYAGSRVGTSGNIATPTFADNATCLNNPWGLDYNNDTGSLFIVDHGNYQIKEVNSSRYISNYKTSVLNTYYSFADIKFKNEMMYFSLNDERVVYKLNTTSDVVTPFAGVYNQNGYTGDGGLATSAKLSYPTQISIADSGQVFIADKDNSAIRMVENGIMTTVVGGPGKNGGDGLASDAKLGQPRGVLYDGFQLFIGDIELSSVFSVTNIIGPISKNNFVSAPVTAISIGATFQVGMYHCTIGNSTDVFCTSATSRQIHRINRFTNQVTVAAGIYQGEYAPANSTGEDGSPAVDAILNFPTGITYDKINDRLFFSESQSNRIRYIKDGKIYHYAGSRLGISGDFTSPVLADNSTSFKFPRGLDYDMYTGNLYIADQDNGKLKVVNASGYVVKLYQTGMHSIAFLTIIELSSFGITPSDVKYQSSTGVFYIAEHDKHVVYKFDSKTRVPSVFAGAPNQPGFSGDGGPSNLAKLVYPRGIHLTDDGVLLIACGVQDEIQNQAVRMVKDGIIDTVIGGPYKPYYASGLTDNVGLDTPMGFAFYNMTLYFTEYDMAKVRIVQLNRTPVPPLAPVPPPSIDMSNANITTISYAQTYNPTACIFGSSYNVFCTTNLGSQILSIDYFGNVTVVAGTFLSQTSAGADGSPAVNATLYSPFGLAYDIANDRLFFSERDANRVRYIKNGKIYHFAGARDGSDGETITPQLADGALLDAPTGIDYDPQTGNLYIADVTNQMIQVVNSTGYMQPILNNTDAAWIKLHKGLLYMSLPTDNTIRTYNMSNGVQNTITGSSTAGWSIDGPVSKGLFNAPNGFWIMPDDRILATDYGNQAIRLIENGYVYTIVGLPKSYSNGPVATSGIGSPYGVIFDGYTMYLTEPLEGAIRKINVYVPPPTTTAAPTTMAPTSAPTTTATPTPAPTTSTLAPTTSAPTTEPPKPTTTAAPSAPTTSAPSTTTTTLGPVVTSPPVAISTGGTLSTVASGNVAEIPKPVVTNSVVLYSSANASSVVPVSFNDTTVLPQNAIIQQAQVSFKVTYIEKRVTVLITLTDEFGDVAGSIRTDITASGTINVDISALYTQILAENQKSIQIRTIRGAILKVSLSVETANVAVNLDTSSVSSTVVYSIVQTAAPTTTPKPTLSAASTLQVLASLIIAFVAMV